MVTLNKYKALIEHAKRRLLVYNDSEVDAADVVGLLKSIGYTAVTVVTDPRNLMAALTTAGAYATLVIDLRMPNLDGLKGIYFIRKKFSAAELPILAISDADAPELCSAALLAGANDHLFRPVDPVDVGLRIRNLLTIRSLYKSGLDAQNTLAREVAARTSKLNMLIQNGLLMSRIKNPDTLIRHTLFEGRRILHCDAATMYKVTPQRSLSFCMRTRADGLPDGEIALYDPATGLPNDRYASTWCALNQQAVRIDDVYTETRFDLSGTRSIDSHTGYRTVSMLTVPVMPREGYVLGVLQFINKLDADTDEVIAFSDEMVTWVEALASQAAVALDNLALNQAQRTQLQSV
jgi:CheY-like chemotaxis protein